MKRILLTLLIVVCCVITLISCNHKHAYSNSWLNDETSHWQSCKKCDELSEKQAHTWDAGLQVATGTEYTCSVCGYKKVAKDFLGSISGKNNDAVELSGVVYGKVSDGFYLSDGTVGAYVKLSTANASKLASVKVGDKVTASGKLSVTTSQVFVKNADVTITSSDEEAIKPTTETLEKITALKASDPASFGKFYNVKVAVSKDQAGRMVFADETGSVFIETTQAAKLASYVDKKVTANIALLSYDSASNAWTVVAFEDGIVEQYVNIQDVQEAIFKKVSIPEVTDYQYKLMTSYNLEPSVEFIWKVKDGNGLTIENNVFTINTELTEDSVVTLELTIKSGPSQTTKEFTTTVPKAVETSLKDALTTTDKLLKVNGLVVARGIADEIASFHYIYIMDEATEDLLTIRCKADVCKSINVGDKIEVIGKVTAMSTEFPDFYSLGGILKLEVKSTGNTVDYSKYQATKLATVEDYQNAIDNQHNEVRLYKVVNPNMIGSGSTSYSWNQFGPTKEAAKSGLVNERQFCLLIANCEFNNLGTWLEDYKVPTKAEGAKYYAGTVFYVYSVFQTGDTKWPFIIPTADACYFDASYAIDAELNDKVETELAATEDGTLILPGTVTVNEVEYTITWSSNNEEVIASTGAYAKQYEACVVELTASYVVAENNYQTTISINVSAAASDPLTVSEAIAQGTGMVYKLNAYVAAIGGSTNNAEEWRNGLVLTDGVKSIYYSTAEYLVGEVEIQVGDFIQIKKGNVTVTEDDVKVSDGSVTILSSGNKIDYSKLEVTTTITNEEEMVAFFGAHGMNTGLVVKFVGPFYFVGCGSTDSNKNPRYQINYVAAAGSPAARYLNKDIESTTKSDGRTVSFCVAATCKVLGDSWYTDAGLPLKSGSKSFECLGEFYAVSCGSGSTMQAWTIINADGSKIEAPSAEYLINKQLAAVFTTDEISAGQNGVLGLPEKVTVGGVDYDITWTSSDPTIVSNAGDYLKVTEEKTVTLTASYTTDGAKAWEKTIKLLPKEITLLTITEVLASTKNAIEGFTGIVAGVASGLGGTIDTYPSQALYVTDGTSVMAIDTFAGELSMTGYTPKAGTTALKVGDIINVYNVTKNDHAIECNENTTVVTNGTKEGNDWFNPTSVTEIKSQADIATYVSTITGTGKKANDANTFGVLKLTGTAENPLYITGTGKYMLSCHYEIADANTAKASSTVVTPGFTVGSGKYCYFGGHVASLHYAMGETWLTTNTCVTAVSSDTSTTSWATVTTPSSTVSIYNWGYTGTIYMIFTYSGSSGYPYLYHGFLGAGCTLVKK